MGRKRRNTAKTGDKSLYSNRQQRQQQQRRHGNDDDEMESLRMYGDDDHDHDNKNNDSSSSTSSHEEIQQVLDLGMGGESSDDDDSSSDDESFLKEEKKKQKQNSGDDESDSDSSSSSDDDDDSIEEELKYQQQQKGATNWGSSKTAYYHGDTADLEIGQDEEDAFVEEEAARDVRDTRFEEMDEDDFALPSSTTTGKKKSSDGEKKTQKREDDTTILDSGSRDVITSKLLSTSAKRKLIMKHHPQLMSMLSYFSETIKDYKSSTKVAVEALKKESNNTTEELGTTQQGNQYVLTKALLQGSIALDGLMYLLLLSQQNNNNDDDDDGIRGMSRGSSSLGNSMQSHPVLVNLKKLELASKMTQSSLGGRVGDIEEQLATLVKAASMTMMVDGDDDDDEEDEDDQSKSNLSSAEENATSTKNRKLYASSTVDDVDDDNQGINDDIAESNNGVDDDMTPESDEESEEHLPLPVAAKRKIDEAKFALRQREVMAAQAKARKGKESKGKKSRKSRSNDISVGMDEYGDIDGTNNDDRRTFAATLNSIEQRSSSRNKNKKRQNLEDMLDDPEFEDGDPGGYDMMEDEFNTDEFMDDEQMEGRQPNKRRSAKHTAGKSSSFYDVIEDMSKKKKAAKNSLYRVAPKYPSLESEVAGERAISRTILKNRGLVAHKAKINRNPRVKKRMQYRKALIRRKGAVREMRADEGHKYGGEGTGIKSGISRSRKL